MNYVIDLNTLGFANDGLFVSLTKKGSKNIIATTASPSKAMQFTDLEKAKKLALKLSKIGKIGSADVYEMRGARTAKLAIASYYKGEDETEVELTYSKRY